MKKFTIDISHASLPQLATTQLNSIVKLERYNMTKKEKKELEESLELLKNWELIEIILDQAKQLEKA